MIQILVVLICASLFAMVYRKKMEDVLPSFIMASAILVYSLGILKFRLDIASYAVIGVYLILAIVFLAILLKNRNAQNVSLKTLFCENVISAPIIILFVTCIVFWLLFSTHRIFNWDDLSYWGIYLKDIFTLGKLPLGVENCTISYKDYNPIMQIFEYFFMFRDGSFNEARPFQINVCFMYVLMLPFLRNVKFGRIYASANDKTLEQSNAVLIGDAGAAQNRAISNIVMIVLFIIFPHIFSTQFYFKLGVDYLMSVLFGYGIWVICDKENKGLMCLFRLIVTATFLTMIKTSGVVLALFLVLFYAVYSDDKKGIKGVAAFVGNGILAGFIPMCYYLSWKLWGRRTGNNGYLSDKVESNVKSLAHAFPDYTGEVVLNYIKHIFTYPLTREKIGITAFGMILLILLVYYVRKKTGDVLIKDRRLFVVIMVGLFVFCLAHIYMYLFVFDDWEAHGLLEFDRYINQYLAGVLYFYLSSLWLDGYRLVSKIREDLSIDENDLSIKASRKLRGLLTGLDPALVALVVLLALLPYPSIKQYLIPANYNKMYAEKYQGMYDATLTEWDRCALKEMSLPLDEDNRVMLLGNAWLDEFQFFTVQMVPQAVTVVENIPALEEGRVSAFCRDLINSRGIDYIYVLDGTSECYTGDFANETRELTMDGSSVENGKSYKVVRNDDGIWLEMIR